MHRLNAEEIRAIIPRCDSKNFDAELFKATGYFVLREAIPPETIRQWQASWEAFREKHLKERQVDWTNPVAVLETYSLYELQTEEVADLYAIQHSSLLVDLAEKTCGPDLAVFYWRMLVKDRQSRGAVPLHQDFAWNLGWPDKTSIFVALSSAGKDNGGLIYYPGTHAFGYLGNAGTIDKTQFGDWPSVRPELMPGDLVLMHCFTWHESEAHISGADRITMQIVYQPSNDPSGQTLVRGVWKTNILHDRHKRDSYYTQSYETKLKTMHADMTQMKSMLEKLLKM